MKKPLILIALVSVLSLFLSNAAFAQARWNPFEASWFIGCRVWSPVSETLSLGQISDLVIDQSNDRIALIILSDVPGFGAERVAVPYGSVVRTGASNFQLRIPSSKIGFGTPGDLYLNKYGNAMAPGVLPAVIDSSWVANLYKQYQQVPYWTEKGEQPLMGFYRSRKLMGAEVQSLQGKMLREIQGLVIDPADGRLVFLVLSHESGKCAVPFDLLSRKDEHTFVLNVTPGKLAATPSFNRYEDLNNRAYATNVYRYFGVQPFWTE